MNNNYNTIATQLRTALLPGLLSALVAMFSSQTSHADPVYFADTGHYYEVILSPQPITWEAAQAAATARGGYLATILSAAENAFVFSLVNNPIYWINTGNSVGPWIGGYQPPGSPEPDGGWTWVNGDGPFGAGSDAYRNWSPLEPNNFDGMESWTHFFAPGNDRIGDQWNDVSSCCQQPIAYVVEYPKKLRVFLDWNAPSVPHGYSSHEVFGFLQAELGFTASTPTFEVPEALRPQIQERVAAIFADSGVPVIEFVDTAQNSVDVRFLQYLTYYPQLNGMSFVGGFFDFGIDRFNDSVDPKAADIFVVPDLLDVEEIATTIAHEVGHSSGLMHVGTGEEVMAPEYTALESHRFQNSIRQMPQLPLYSHNPLFHLKRYVEGLSRELLEAQGYHPGSWDTESVLEDIRFQLGFNSQTSSSRTSPAQSALDLPLYDVDVLIGYGDAALRPLMHVDEITLADLAQIVFPLKLGNTFHLFASSTPDASSADIVLSLGDPFTGGNLDIPVISGEQLAMLQMQSGPDTFTTLSDVTVAGAVTGADIAAVSRLNHGTEGAFDVELPLSGEPGVECRDGGGNYTMAITFPSNLLDGKATVTAGTGAIAGDPSFTNNTMTVNLTGVTDVQTLTVTVSGVTDELSQVYADTLINMNVLIADANGDKTVALQDFTQVKSQVGQPVTVANFRDDIDGNGVINRKDGKAVRLRKGNSLP